MRYRLSRVLQAISEDRVGSTVGRSGAAKIAAFRVQCAAHSSFERALDACYATIPASVGLPPVPTSLSPRFHRHVKLVHDRLVAEAIRLGVPMEDC